MAAEGPEDARVELDRDRPEIRADARLDARPEAPDMEAPDVQVPDAQVPDVAPIPCQPDRSEPDDRPQDALLIEALHTEMTRTFCPAGDDDWFLLPMGLDEGLRIELRVRGAGGVLLGVYAHRDGGTWPVHREVVTERVGDDQLYRLEVPPNQGAFFEAEWFLRTYADYEATYDLTITRLSGPPPCVDDPHEPNDTLATGTDLAVPYGEFEVPGPHMHCPRNDDYYCLELAEGDGLEAWAEGVGLRDAAYVKLVDAQHQSVGGFGAVTDPGEPEERIFHNFAAAGRYCIQVTNEGVGRGPYRLFTHRFPNEIQCLPPDDNDDPTTAAALPEVVAERRFQGEQLAICPQDVDWYRFPVATTPARLCITLDEFPPLAWSGIALFRDRPGEAHHRRCRDVFQCGEEQACIQGSCQSALGRNWHMIALDTQADPGSWLIQVVGGPLVHRLTTTLIPDESPCPADWRERDRPNDQLESATPLGAGIVGLCDAWICEGGESDWYRITVPAGQDRVVYIRFRNQEDGRLFLDYQGPPSDPADVFSGFRRSDQPDTDAQCIHIQGGSQDHDVFVRVFENLQRPDGDPRIDYTLHVLPTPLDARQEGSCAWLAGPEFEWPRVRLP